MKKAIQTGLLSALLPFLVTCSGTTSSTAGLPVPNSSLRHPSGTPAFFTRREPNCGDFAKAINHYVRLGETKAVRELKSLATSNHGDSLEKFRLSVQVGELCRVLFSGKRGIPLRPYREGQRTGLPDDLKDPSRFPLYPVIESRGIHFIATGNPIVLAGVMEPAASYLDYCVLNGSFRDHPVTVPTRAEAERALVSLRESKAWKSVVWDGAGFKSSIDAEITAFAGLQKQTPGLREARN